MYHGFDTLFTREKLRFTSFRFQVNVCYGVLLLRISGFYSSPSKRAWTLKPFLFLIILLLLPLVLLLLPLSFDTNIAVTRLHRVFFTFRVRLAQQATPGTFTRLVLGFTADPFATLVTVIRGDSHRTHGGWTFGRRVGDLIGEVDVSGCLIAVQRRQVCTKPGGI